MALVEFNKAMKNCPCLAFNMIEHQSRQRPSESVQASVTGAAIIMLCLGPAIQGTPQSISVECRPHQHHSLHCEPGLHSMIPAGCGATKNSSEDMEQIDDMEFLSSAGASESRLNTQINM